MENKSVFEQLFEINVDEHVERKNELQYLLWAYAWAEVKKLFSKSTYKVYESGNSCIYHMDGRAYWVKTSVMLEGLEHIEYLPIMDCKKIGPYCS